MLLSNTEEEFMGAGTICFVMHTTAGRISRIKYNTWIAPCNETKQNHIILLLITPGSSVTLGLLPAMKQSKTM